MLFIKGISKVVTQPLKNDGMIKHYKSIRNEK